MPDLPATISVCGIDYSDASINYCTNPSCPLGDVSSCVFGTQYLAMELLDVVSFLMTRALFVFVVIGMRSGQYVLLHTLRALRRRVGSPDDDQPLDGGGGT